MHSVLDGTEIVCKSTCHQEWEEIDVMNLLLTVTINKISQTKNTNISTRIDGTEIVCKSTCHQEWEEIDVMNLLLTVTINKISQTENTNISTGKAA